MIEDRRFGAGKGGRAATVAAAAAPRKRNGPFRCVCIHNQGISAAIWIAVKTRRGRGKEIMLLGQVKRKHRCCVRVAVLAHAGHRRRHEQPQVVVAHARNAL